MLKVTTTSDKTGKSDAINSLSYLRSYPFDVLKIDRSFINDTSNDPTDRELINAIIAMSRALGLKVVAEGVETEDETSTDPRSVSPRPEHGSARKSRLKVFQNQ